MYADILLATDGSDSAREATDHAIDLARTYEATLHAVYVVETRRGYDSGIVDPETVEERLREEGESVLEDVETAAREAGVDVSTSLLRGVPEREILECVDDHGIDIAILGARGTSSFKTVLLGSTSEAVVREASIPVVLMPAPGEVDEAGES